MPAATFGTIVNPTKKLTEYLATHAANQLAKSLITVSTPQYAGQLKHLPSAFPHLQVVGFACDTVPLGSQRSGFSFLLSDSNLKIKEKADLEVDKSRNWSQTQAAVRMALPNADIQISAANTLFSTGQQAEIYGLNSDPLSSLYIELDLAHKQKQNIRPAKQLSEWMKITGAVDNMLKTLDNGRAAQSLETCPDLQTLRDPRVFAELESTGEFVQVIAGGGGLWSPRASMLVLEPPLKLVVGDRLRFWLEQELSSDLESQLASAPENSIVVETSPVPQTLEDESPLIQYKKNHFLPLFGFGSERGFITGDHAKHTVVGESVILG